MNTPRIILTGGTGFIGSHIAEYFSAHGIAPVCLVRNGNPASFLRTLPVTLAQGDITAPDDLARIFRGAEAVIHAAARVSDWGPREAFVRTNVEGTRNVMRAALDAGVAHVIITGSNSCFGEESSTIVKDEESPCTSHHPYFLDAVMPSAMNHYRDTKAQSIAESMDFAQRHEMNLTVIDPVWVYGERELHTGFYDYLATVRAGIPAFPGSRSNKFHTIYARDLAHLYHRVYEARLPGVHRFIACDPAAELQWKLFGMFCTEAGMRAPRLLPKFVVYPFAFVMEAAAMLVRRRTPPLLTRARVAMFYDNIEYSGRKARELLQFEPEIPRAESIRATVAWYREHHML